jgi:hypothetical protein
LNTVIPFYFADRFSGAVVHLTTTGQRGRCLASCYLNETVSGEQIINVLKKQNARTGRADTGISAINNRGSNVTTLITYADRVFRSVNDSASRLYL